MTERGTFRVFMRIIGVLFAGYGICGALGGGLTAIGFQSSRYYSALDRVGAGLAYAVAGLVLLFAAEAITRLIYGRDTNSN
jgi:hypothetical protein